jgi:hypothetical protein
VHDTLVLHETITDLVHDTLVLHETIADLVHDTLILHETITSLVHDTLILRETITSLVHDTLVLHETIADLVHDTLVLHETIADLVHDTLVLRETITDLVHDTLRLHETVTELVHDTLVLRETITDLVRDTILLHDKVEDCAAGSPTSAILRGLSVAGVDLDKSFDPDLTDYRATLDCNASTAQIRAIQDDGTELDLRITLSTPTDSIVTIIATAAGKTPRSYTLHIVRPIDNLVHQLWSDVLVVNQNPANNGGYNTANLEWQKNGESTGKTTPQYNLTEAEVKSTDYYNVRLFMGDKEIPSCLLGHTAQLEAAMVAYPNPTRGTITVALPQDGRIEVYSLGGALMCSIPAIAGNTTMNLGILPQGVYMLKAAGQVVKVVVTK